VGYDARSLRLNGRRALFLSGSLHPARHTRRTWEAAVRRAVLGGLNMVTLYVVWSSHQPYPGSPLDFDSFGWLTADAGAGAEPGSPYNDTEGGPSPDGGSWSLAASIQIASDLGLFVHVRVGPYACGEYSYGGVPEWLPVVEPGMDMRRPDRRWMRWTRYYVSGLARYLERHELWAHQGGPVILAQIENELQQDEGEEGRDGAAGGAALQRYADWCGRLARSLVPGVVWTMCNGLSARGTVETFNGDWSGAEWLARGGDTGRIQADQPALWTENEGADLL
jgi:beta-galactosidase GanA